MTGSNTENYKVPAPGQLVAESIEVKKYYFVYATLQHDFIPKQGPGRSHEARAERFLCDVHPLQFEADHNEEYGEYKMESHGEIRENITVISWQELSKEEYDKFKDHF